MPWKGWNKKVFPYNNDGKLNDDEAYKIICRKFDEFLNFDDYEFRDLSYYLKMFFENGKLYISDEVAKQPEFRVLPIEKVNYNNRGKKGKEGNKWEHMTPIKVLLEYALYLYCQGKFTQAAYVNLRERFGGVCIVTKEEDDKLSKEYKQSMPSNPIQIEHCGQATDTKLPETVYILDESVSGFARYEALKIGFSLLK